MADVPQLVNDSGGPQSEVDMREAKRALAVDSEFQVQAIPTLLSMKCTTHNWIVE